MNFLNIIFQDFFAKIVNYGYILCRLYDNSMWTSDFYQIELPNWTKKSYYTVILPHYLVEELSQCSYFKNRWLNPNKKKATNQFVSMDIYVEKMGQKIKKMCYTP